MMITNGRFYSAIAGSKPEGNDKYSSELRSCIEETAELCFDNLKKRAEGANRFRRLLRGCRRG